jgi:hypothetical protein
VLDETLNGINALKNVLSVTVGAVTLLAFALFGPVDWSAVLVLAPATVVGGYAGARLARRLPSRALKALIVAFGTTTDWSCWAGRSSDPGVFTERDHADIAPVRRPGTAVDSRAAGWKPATPW